MNSARRELLNFDVVALGEKFRARELSPVEVTEAYLERIGEVDGKVRSYITVTANLARKSARKAEEEIGAGKSRGAFHGVPIALKDLIYTRGIKTTGGSKILADFVPKFDATVWARLRRQGAVLLGKLNLHEFAYGVTSTNPHYGAVRNPYNLERIPGGSSGGSAAAIAASEAAATIGTDTGCSIRIPAALCGCVGLMPTWSRVSRYGVIPLASSLDHVGPITRSVRDAAVMLNAIAGRDGNDSTCSRTRVPDYLSGFDADVSGLRVGIIRELSDNLSTDVRASFEAAIATLKSLGAIVEETSIPSMPMAAIINSLITFSEAIEYHQEWMQSRPRDYGDDTRRLLEIGMMTPVSTYIRAQRARARVTADALAQFATFDVMVAPTAAITAPRIATGNVLDGGSAAQPDLIANILRFNQPFDVTGQPVLAVPTGIASDGLPTSMQVIGKLFDEATILRVGAAYERARGALAPPPEIV